MSRPRGRRVRQPEVAPLARNVLGGVLAVALVGGGIAALQALVPPPGRRDGPVVKAPTTVALPSVSSPPAIEQTVVVTTPPPPPPPSTLPPVTPSPRPSPTAEARPALTVLNNSRINGLAARAARDFAEGGWRIAATGNLRGRTPRTTVYYDRGHAGAAAALRRQFPRIQAALPRPDGVPGAGTLTVVVTRDYA